MQYRHTAYYTFNDIDREDWSYIDYFISLQRLKTVIVRVW